MPYRINPRDPREVQVQRSDGRWQTLKRHATAAEALAHLRALLINVSDKHRERR